MNKKNLFLYILFVVLLFVAGVYLFKKDNNNKPIVFQPPFILPTVTPIISSAPPTQSVSSQSAELATVRRVIDGDTIELSDGRKVRYIGIDTPELHHPTKRVQCFGKEAMEKNKELVEGKTVTMKKDVSETDKYKRLLRYVWTGNIFINEYLVREGYALQATFPPDVKYVKLFKQAAEEARIKNKGLWNSCK